MAFFRLPNSSRYFRPKHPSLEIGKELSRGAYGSVHSGRLNGKEVAVKRLHGLLLEAARGQGDFDTILLDFRHECDLLERVDHSHVVGFKGAFYDETTDEPILVMELMTENLRQYLERNRGQLSRQKQLAICVEIVRGLRFLHTRTPPIVHRDLTDKNILLDADGVVKIGDLGQSRLKTADYFSTGQPGAIPFMSPEAMQEQSHYNEKLDMFSLGVLVLEIATQQPPRVGMVGIGVTPELQRRRGDLSKLDDDHPLRPLILSCLKDNPKERPDIDTVHSQLLSMVEGVETVLSTASRPTQEVCSPTLGSELQTLQSTASRPTQEVCSPTSGSDVFQTSHLLEDPPTLHSVKLQELPIETLHATAVVIARSVYICGGGCIDIASARVVQVYDIDRSTWAKLPPSPQYNSEATAIDDKLVLIGGREALSCAVTNNVSTWSGEGWECDIPAMPAKRSRPSVMTCGTYVLVAGGKAEDDQTILTSIDVLDITTHQWQMQANLQLPQPMYVMRMTLCGTHIYVASAAIAYDATTKRSTYSTSVWQLPVVTLLKVLQNEDRSPLQWVKTAPTPFYRSAMLQHTAQPLAIGGDDDLHKPTRNIAVYDPRSNKWSTVGQLLEPRVRCTAVSLSRGSFLVCGGSSDCRNRSTLLNSVELVYMS